MLQSPSTTIDRPELSPAEGGTREEWIDCLRGITMLLVVMMHFEVECGRWMDVSKWISMIRMPMFLFISGYFAYSPKIRWGVKPLLKGQMLRRARLILWPSLIIFLLYAPCFMHVYSFTVKNILHTGTMVGYWYTFVIFEMFVLCAPLVCLLNGGAWRRQSATIGLIAMMGVAMYVQHMLNDPQIGENKFTLLFMVNLLTKYLPFFIAGLLVHTYRERVWRLCGNLWMPLLLALALLVLLNVHYHVPFPFIEDPTATMPLFVVMTVCMFVSFSGLKGVLHSGTKVGRVLSLVGRNTLPIYLFHFFFNLWIGRVIIQGHFREFTTESVFWMPFVILMTVAITASCLGIYLLLDRIGVRKFIFPGHPSGLRGYKPQQKSIKILQA